MSTVTDDMVEGGKLECGCPWFYVPDYPDEGHVPRHVDGCVKGDWHQVEDALNLAARGAMDPLWTETQHALTSLMNLGSLASDAGAWRARAHVAEKIQGELRSEVQRATDMLARQLWITANDQDVKPGEPCFWDTDGLLADDYEEWRTEASALIERGPDTEPRDRGE